MPPPLPVVGPIYAPTSRARRGNKLLELLRLLLTSARHITVLDVAQKLALVYVAIHFASFVKSRPWVAKHRLPADVQALLANREPPDAELFPQYFPSPSTGLWLYSRQWLPPTPARGVIFVVPGMGEHTGRYEFLASSMTKLGLAVFSLDHQGHGASEGDRCFVERFRHYVIDLAGFVSHVLQSRPQYAHLPRFLFGHSLGGAISILMANATTASAAFAADGAAAPAAPPLSWTGVILSAPAIVPDPKVKTPLKVFVGKALASVLPKFALAPLPASGISTNAQVHNLYRTDPLIYHGGVQVRWGYETLKALDAIHATVETIVFPFLIMHGMDDSIVSPAGSVDFHRRAASRDKSIKTYEGLKHEILNEPKEARHRVIADISGWIEARMSSDAAPEAGHN